MILASKRCSRGNGVYLGKGVEILASNIFKSLTGRQLVKRSKDYAKGCQMAYSRKDLKSRE